MAHKCSTKMYFWNSSIKLKGFWIYFRFSNFDYRIFNCEDFSVCGKIFNNSFNYFNLFFYYPAINIGSMKYIVYYRIHLSDIFAKLSHFLLLKLKFYCFRLMIYFVRSFLKSHSFQVTKPNRNIFVAAMSTRLISRMVLSTQEKSSWAPA